MSVSHFQNYGTGVFAFNIEAHDSLILANLEWGTQKSPLKIQSPILSLLRFE